MSTHRILIVTLSNIGDAVMTTPVLSVLNQLYPDARIDLVCDPRSAALFVSCPYLGHLHVRDKQSGWIGYLQLIAQLRQVRYDLVVDLRTDFLASLLKANIRFYKLKRAQARHLHAVEKHLSAIRTLVGEVTPRLVLWTSSADQARVSRQFPITGTWLAIGLGANFAGKRWPVDRYVAVANALMGHVDGVVLLGSVAERELAQCFVRQSHLPVLDATGQLSLSQSYALLKQCCAFLGNDSGLGHMAAAAGLPSLTLFGPGEPARYVPWSRAAWFIQDAEQNILGISVHLVVRQMHQLLLQFESGA